MVLADPAPQLLRVGIQLGWSLRSGSRLRSAPQILAHGVARQPQLLRDAANRRALNGHLPYRVHDPTPQHGPLLSCDASLRTGTAQRSGSSFTASLGQFYAALYTPAIKWCRVGRREWSRPPSREDG